MCGKALPLRPHHGMCLAYFAGRGYSEEFTAHLSRLKAALTPDTLIRLTLGTDIICSACPNNLDGICEKPALVEGYDRAVLAFCDLKDGQILPYGTFCALVEGRILSRGRRRQICGNCEWDIYCGGVSSPQKKV